MTTMQPRELWSTMPGWGIVANLIPPEVLQARRVRAIRKLIAYALCLLVLIAGAGYSFAWYRSQQAADALAAEQSRTSQLLVQQKRYADVTLLQGSVAGVRTELSHLLASDVDMSALVASILAQLPAGATVSQLAVTMSVPGTKQAMTNLASGPGSLDTSSHPHIGLVSVTGQAARVSDVSTLVDRLTILPGFIDPYPTSNTTNDKGTLFTVQFSVNDKLLSHRYDVTAKTGGK
jgi:type IV pilus assembly protein PilN